MITGLAFLIAFAVASLVRWLVVMNREDTPLHFRFLARCPTFYVYGAVYGLLAIIVLALLGGGSTDEEFQVWSMSVRHPLFKGVLAGVLVGLGMSLADGHITMFIPKLGFPIRFRVPLVATLDGKAFARICREHDRRVKLYLQPYLDHYRDLGEVRKRIIDSFPPSLPRAEREAFIHDVLDDDWFDTPEKLLSKFVAAYGSSALKMEFPVSESKSCSERKAL